jgi:hypothetical protein
LIAIPSSFLNPKYVGKSLSLSPITLIDLDRISIDDVLSLIDLNFNVGNVVVFSFALSEKYKALDDLRAFKKSRYVESITSSGTAK